MNTEKSMGIMIFFLLALLAGVFAAENVCAKTSPADDASSYTIISQRNIFRPLWQVPAGDSGGTTRSRMEELEALKKAEQERQQAQKRTEEQNQLTEKKREIEQNYTLTGIVFEQGRKQAIIQDKKGIVYMVYANDTLNEVKVLSIDDAEGKIVVDYENKFTATIQMK